MKLNKELGGLLLGVWLILIGAVSLFNLNIPAGNTVMGLLALFSGVLLVRKEA